MKDCKDLKINSKDFLKYLFEVCPTNLKFIKSIRFNKKSISIKLDDPTERNFIFNGFFTESNLYYLIISYLISYIKLNNINYPIDKDYLETKFKTIKIN